MTSQEGTRSGKKKRRRKHGPSMNRIHPEGSSGDASSLSQQGFDYAEMKDNNRDVGEIATAADAFNILSNVKKGAERFKGLRCHRRQGAVDSRMGLFKTGKGIDDSIMPEPLRRNRFNEALISYFARLARSDIEDEVIDLEYVEQLLANGADICCTDKHGQTVLHEAVRAWDTDVASFLLENGAKPNQRDRYGRSPLHVAAAVNYPDMIMILVDNEHDKAEIEILTEGENQTPLHFAARNDAHSALKKLHKLGANIHARDYKGRTPLQVAAELDRSETAKILLELGANAADIDFAGQTALVQLISKMPAVAKEALDQFHTCDRANRRQYYDHHLIEPTKPDDNTPRARSALQVIVKYNQLELILHPVIQRLLAVKWTKFGRFWACIQVLLNLTFIILWSIIACSLRENERMTFPRDIWRIIIWALALLITGFMIIQELQEIYVSKKKFRRWKDWRIREIEKDLKFCHPQWPQEEQYLSQEIKDIKGQSAAYFSEFWNYFDWLVYFVLLGLTGIILASHIVQNDEAHENMIGIARRIMAVAIIPIWLRFMKTARAFKQLGPFIVMLGHIISDDVLKFGFLYLEFYIPYAVAFWVIFGGKESIPSMQTVDSLLYTLFRLTLVDEYEYDRMHSLDAVMAYILLTTFLFLSALLCINLFIALLSDTFQRVYDNANSNAAMQQASIILGIEEGLSKKKLRKFRQFIHHEAGPESLYYDDDQTVGGEADLKKVTFQIKDSLDELQTRLADQHKSERRTSAEPRPQSQATEAKSLREELTHFRVRQERSIRHVQKQLRTVTEVLQALLAAQTGGSSGPGGGRPDTAPGHPLTTPSRPVGVTSMLTPLAHPGLLVTQPSLPHGEGMRGGPGVLAFPRPGGGFEEEEDDYETAKKPRFVGRHAPLQSTPLPPVKLRGSSPVESLATQRSFLEIGAPPPAIQETPQLDEADKEKLSVFRAEKKKKLKQRKQQEAYLLQQQQGRAEVTLPMSEIGRGQKEEGEEAAEAAEAEEAVGPVPRFLGRQLGTQESQQELADLIRFSPATKDVEKQEVQDDRGSTDA